MTQGPYGSPEPGEQPPTYHQPGGYAPYQPPAAGPGPAGPSSPYGYPGPAGLYGFDPHAPYGREPMTGQPWSSKQKSVAGLLQLLLPFVGVCGVGRLYQGQVTIGVVQLVGFWASWFVALFLFFLVLPLLLPVGLWLWSVVDGILLLAGQPRDERGLLLR